MGISLRDKGIAMGKPKDGVLQVYGIRRRRLPVRVACPGHACEVLDPHRRTFAVKLVSVRPAKPNEALSVGFLHQTATRIFRRDLQFDPGPEHGFIDLLFLLLCRRLQGAKRRQSLPFRCVNFGRVDASNPRRGRFADYRLGVVNGHLRKMVVKNNEWHRLNVKMVLPEECFHLALLDIEAFHHPCGFQGIDKCSATLRPHLVAVRGDLEQIAFRHCEAPLGICSQHRAELLPVIWLPGGLAGDILMIEVKRFH
jgi:hypothetical protein